MSETFELIAVVKARTMDALRKINNFTKGVQKSEKELTAFESAGRIAAGVLLRDMVRGATAAFSETIKLGASIETLINSFNALTKDAGATDLTLESLRKATKGTISDVDLLTAANTALALGLPVDELDDLFAASLDVGHAMGSTTLQAVSDITRGMGRLSPLILDNLGIIVNTDLAYENYAATLGKTVSALTAAEKRTAFQTAAMESLNKKAAVLEGTTSDAAISQERFAATMENLKTSVGALLTPLGAVAPILEAGMPMFGTFAAILIPNLISQYGALGLATTTWGTLTAAASKLVTVSIYGIPIIGWIAAAIAALIALSAAWKNNWFGIRDTVKNVSDVVMEKIGWLFDGIKTFTDGVKGVLDWLGIQWANLTGTLDAQLVAQQESLVQSYEEQVQIIKDKMAVALAEVETNYGAMREAAEKAHGKEIDEHAKFWIDQLTVQAEGFDKAVEEYQKHYDQLESNTKTHFDDLISDAKQHSADLLSETKKTYDEQTQSAIDYWMGLITETITALDEVLASYNTHYDSLEAESKSTYDEQLATTTTFYDDMLAEQSAFLVAIREGRSRDLDDLELNFLLQKRSLEQSLTDQKITQEEFEEKLSELEKTYRDERSDIRDDYRIQELQAEDEFRTEEERINAERAAELEKIEQEKTDAITSINEERAAMLTAMEGSLGTVLSTIAQEKADTITGIEEDLKTKTEELEQAKADEVARINEERKTKIEEIRADEANLEKEHAKEMQKLENEKAAEIAGIQAQAELDLIKAQRQFHADLEKAEKKHKTATEGIWGDLWASVKKTAKNIADKFSGAVSAAKSAYNKVKSWWEKATSKRKAAKKAEEETEEIETGMGGADIGAQYGFEGMVTRPTTFLAGEGGRPEYVSITPVGARAPAPIGRSITIKGPLVVIEGSADEATARMAAELIMRDLRKY